MDSQQTPMPMPTQTQTQQLNRSCEACRSLKVRCLPDASSTTQCQRCAKAKRECIFVAPQRRRPRKRTDTRVAQLEREMAAMRTALKGRHLIVGDAAAKEDEEDEEEEQSMAAVSAEDNDDAASVKADEAAADDIDFGSEVVRPPQPPNYQDIQYNLAQHALHEKSRSPGLGHPSQASGDGRSSSLGDTPALSLNSSQPDSYGELDVVDRGLISIDTAESLVSLFIHDLLAIFPFMVFPAKTSARGLRASKPTLFLAIVTAAAIAVDAKLASALNRELLNLYAQRFFIQAEKSLEMVQALIVMTVFSLPPELPSQIQTYQYPHIAATMALEIGIASRQRLPRKPVPGSSQTGQSKQKNKFDEKMAEEARTILACYHLASNVAMRTRRPNLLAYNDWIKECVRILSRSPHESDKRYASWFGLQIITDEALSSFGLDDTSSTAVLSETRVNGVLRLFDKKMDDWKEDIDEEFLTVSMLLEYQYTRLVVYELGIGEGYREPDAIKRQYYTLPAPDEDTFANRPTEPLSAIRVDLNIKWMHAAQGLLNTFLECDVHTMRKLPNLMYTRIVLGLMVLLKIYFSVRSGALGEVIADETLQVENYVEQTSQKLAEASAGSKYAIPARWLRVVGGKARDWLNRFQRHCAEREERQQQQQQMQMQIQSKARTDNNNKLSVNTETTTATAAIVSMSGQVSAVHAATTVSDVWHGGLVPTPTPITYSTHPTLSRDHGLPHLPPHSMDAQQQQQQPHLFGAFNHMAVVQDTSGASKGPVAPTTSNSYYNSYSQSTSWVGPAVFVGTNEYHHQIPHPPPPAPPAAAPPHQNVWNLQPAQIPLALALAQPQQNQQLQQLSDMHNQGFTTAGMVNDINNQDGFPMEMDYEWVPMQGIFQLPKF